MIRRGAASLYDRASAHPAPHRGPAPGANRGYSGITPKGYPAALLRCPHHPRPPRYAAIAVAVARSAATWRAIAQTNPNNSRATATAAFGFGLPLTTRWT
jgi:hypothetical protein